MWQRPGVHMVKEKKRIAESYDSEEMATCDETIALRWSA